MRGTISAIVGRGAGQYLVEDSGDCISSRKNEER